MWDGRKVAALLRGPAGPTLDALMLLVMNRSISEPYDRHSVAEVGCMAGAIAAARLPVLGPWPALRSRSACPRMIRVLCRSEQAEDEQLSGYGGVQLGAVIQG
ncbi:hypothetical protein GCM10023085_33310 [Actinomadura viridis]